MGSVRTIYLPEELNKKLAHHGNASQLINRLLCEYFGSLNKELSNKNVSANDWITDVDKELKEQEVIDNALKQKKEKQKEVIKNNLFDFVQRDITFEEIEEYLELFNSGKMDLWTFAEELKKRDELRTLNEIEKSTTYK
jgi:hypothetical protein